MGHESNDQLDKPALHARRLQVLRKSLDRILKVGTINQGQAAIRANTQLLEGTLRIRVALILLIRVLDRPRAQRIPLQHLVLGVEEEPLSRFTALLLFLLRPRLFHVELRLDLFVVLRDNQVVGEVVWFFVLDGPGHLLQQHVVHGWDDLRGHIDHALGQDEADWRQGSLREELFEGGEGGVGAGLALEVFDQVLDDGLVLSRVVRL